MTNGSDGPSPEPRLLFALAAIVSLVAAATLWSGPALLRADVFDDDASQHVWWLYQYANAALFPGDVMVDYFRTSAPLGYRALYAVIAPLGDALFAAKLVAAVLYLVSGWLAWKAATAIEGPHRTLRGLLVVAAFILVVNATRNNAGSVLPAVALQRTFSLPLLLLCLWALIARRYVWVGASWVGSALVYPVLLPVTGLAAGCVFLHDLWLEKRMPRAWLPNGLAGVAALALAIFGMPQAEELGPAFTYTEAIAMPEFGPGGRLQLYERSSLIGDFVRHPVTGLGWSPYFLLVLAAAVLLVWSRGGRRLVPWPAWAVVGVGCGLWLLMRLFPAELMFGLYLPNRHSRWAIAIFAIVAFGAAAYVVLDWVGQKIWNRPAQAPWSAKQAWLIAVAVPALTAFLLWPHAAEQLRRPVDEDMERVYAFLSTLPSDTLIAAHPTLADYVPLRSQRSVLTSTETSMPWMRGYYEIVKPRVEASLRAAYATDITQLDSELAPFGVDVFVTGPMVWNQTHYHEPYDHELFQGLLAEGRRRGFALLHPPPERVLFRSGDYYVLRVGG